MSHVFKCLVVTGWGKKSGTYMLYVDICRSLKLGATKTKQSLQRPC